MLLDPEHTARVLRLAIFVQGHTCKLLRAADQVGSRVKSFAANANCRLAVVVLFDSTVTVWDTSSMECASLLQSWGDRDAARVHSGGVNAAYLTPDGSWAVTVSKDHTARVWDVRTAECRSVLRGLPSGQ